MPIGSIGDFEKILNFFENFAPRFPEKEVRELRLALSFETRESMLEFSTYTLNRAPRGHPQREVRIQIYGAWGRGPNREIFVTSLTSAQEVDHRIDGMIERLERIRAEAKAKLEENA